MPVIQFPDPIEWEGKTYTEVDTDRVGQLKGRDKLAIMRELRRAKVHDVLQPEMDERYILAALSRATGIPEEVFGELPLQAFNEVLLEAQCSMLGSDSEVAKSPSES